MKHRLPLPDTNDFVVRHNLIYTYHSERAKRLLRRHIVDWCNENVTGRWKYVDADGYDRRYERVMKITRPVMCFGRKADAALFKLRWL